MSMYYSFYLGSRDEDNKMRIVGPYYYDTKSGETKLGVLLERSGSFIDSEDFDDFMKQLPVEEIAEKDKKLLTFSDTFFNEGKAASRTLYASLSKFYSVANANDNGLYSGYVPLNELNYLKENNYHIDSKYDVELISSDVAAEMSPEDRKQYGKAAFVATSDTSYLAHLVVSAADSVLNYVYGNDKKNYYILMAWS